MALAIMFPAVASSHSRGFAYKPVITSSSPGAGNFSFPTVVTVAPDGRLFVAQKDGRIFYATLDATYNVVTSVTEVDTIYNIGGAPNGRLVTGMAFGPAGDLFVSHSDGLINSLGVNITSGQVTRLYASTSFTTGTLIANNLPRSKESHAPNGLAFKPGTNLLYLAVGGMTNAGLPSSQFFNVAESAESAAVIEIDVTTSARSVYASGFRNPYDLMWHSNGNLYLNDNGPNTGQGDPTNNLGSCTLPGTLVVWPDELNLVLAGHYYGHPNPSRAQCYLSGAGVDLPIHTYGLNTSSDGIAEYTSTKLPGLQGRLLTVNFANGKVVGVTVSGSTAGATERILWQGLGLPVDLAVRSSDGAIFLAEYSPSKISVLRVKQAAVMDYDGDGRSDFVVASPTTSVWNRHLTSTGVSSVMGTFGGGSQIPFAIDFDGDGLTDVAVFDPATGNWIVGGFGTFAVGAPGDVPVAGDLDGDGRTDLVAVSPTTSQWHERLSSTGTVVTPGTFGGGSQIPFLVDVTGSGFALPAAYDPATATWFVAGGGSFTLGSPGDVPVVGDLDGDGRTDFAVVNPTTSVWTERLSSTGAVITPGTFGGGSMIPYLVDAAGTGVSLPAAWDPTTGTWYVAGYGTFTLGSPGDVPVRIAF
jgi:glucose/arabinose dehydrogenase